MLVQVHNVLVAQTGGVRHVHDRLPVGVDFYKSVSLEHSLANPLTYTLTPLDMLTAPVVATAVTV
jgi:hypothetical protein